ncbi:hypothetical protein [Colwellia piezophila]|uniref:hypothetical protein n=1 Tax=Colwellia piezophila TaxID=211668 RepID=UPI000377E827|nr:hypothetical protein [Colwellia piezophila]
MRVRISRSPPYKAKRVPIRGARFRICSKILLKQAVDVITIDYFPSTSPCFPSYSSTFSLLNIDPQPSFRVSFTPKCSLSARANILIED